MPELVEQTTPEGVDYGWVMQTTFVLTILVGAPLIAVLAVSRPLPTWEARAVFAIRVGSLVWILVGLTVFLYAYRRATTEGSSTDDSVEG